MWQITGTKVELENGNYTATCTIKKEMSFDEMRNIMKQEGRISTFEEGQATSEEMLEVLMYASNYYDKSENKSARAK